MRVKPNHNMTCNRDSHATCTQLTVSTPDDRQDILAAGTGSTVCMRGHASSPWILQYLIHQRQGVGLADMKPGNKDEEIMIIGIKPTT